MINYNSLQPNNETFIKVEKSTTQACLLSQLKSIIVKRMNLMDQAVTKQLSIALNWSAVFDHHTHLPFKISHVIFSLSLVYP